MMPDMSSELKNLPFTKKEPFLFVNKVSGQNTHAPDVDQPGLAEMIQKWEGFKVYTVSRLDKGTSGALVFALDPVTAAELTTLFEKHEVQKTYLFLSHKKHKDHKFSRQSLIYKNGSLPESDPHSSQPNATTEFEFVQSVGKFFLYKAFPKTGKPHQIRLHAADCGIPVLGDSEHGGLTFYRLCLHSSSLQFNWKNEVISYQSPSPVWLNPFTEKELQAFEALSRRQALLRLDRQESNCWRWLHNEVPEFRLDQFGEALWAYWYKNELPNTEEMKLLETLQRTLGRPMWIREMVNRGAKGEKSHLLKLGDPPQKWISLENGMRFEMRCDQGLSPGLFLDQRENRKWVRDHAKDRKVLNLFGYTGGFSVAAALGGAVQVASVDVSRTYLDWAQTNFSLNHLEAQNPRFEFWEADALFFLKAALKKGRKFDLIICDPPSVGRSKEGTFKIHKNLPELLDMVLQLLEPGGELLLSSNYEGWTLLDLQKQVFVYRQIYGVEILPTPHAGLDFELPHETPLMKSLIVRKNKATKRP